MNNFTPRAQQVLALARREADRFNHNYVGTEHMLLGLIRLGQGVAVNALVGLGQKLETLRAEVEKMVGSGPDSKMSGNIPYTPRVKKVLALAGKSAMAMGHHFVGTEHILLGLLWEGDGVAARVLRTAGLDMEPLRERILFELSPSGDPALHRGRQGLPNPQPYSMPSVPDWISPTSAGVKGPENPPHPAIAAYLARDETLLWSGSPKKKFRFERKHWPVFFLVLPFLAFLLLPIMGAFHSDSSASVPAKAPSAQTQPTAGASSSPAAPAHKQTAAERIFETVFFLCFFGGITGWIAFCFASALGLNVPLSGETVYGVTNQRIVVVAGKREKTIRSVHLGTATDLRMKEWPDGLGSISFGPEPVWPYASPLRNSNTVLENIAEPRKVFQLIIQARKRA